MQTSPVGFSALDPAEDDRPLRQGDVFEWNIARDRWTRWGILLTADCDFAQSTHNGILSYVPLLEVKDYLAEMRLPLLVEKSLTKVEDKLCTMLWKLQSSQAQFPVPIARDVAIEWIRRDSIQDIARALELKTLPENLQKAIARCKGASDALADGGFDALFGSAAA